MNYIYTGKIKINGSNAKELYLAAGFFQTRYKTTVPIVWTDGK